jgi:hypothetical protein
MGGSSSALRNLADSDDTASLLACMSHPDWRLSVRLTCRRGRDLFPNGTRTRTAAMGKRLATARWSVEEARLPPKYNNGLCVGAAAEGNVEVLHWAFQRGLGDRHQTVCRAAGLHGHVHVLEYMSGVSLVLPPALARAAMDGGASGGCIRAMEWALAHGASPQAQDCSAAAARGRVAALCWLRAHGAPWTTEVLSLSFLGGHEDLFLRCLREGCPVGAATLVCVANAGAADGTLYQMLQRCTDDLRLVVATSLMRHYPVNTTARGEWSSAYLEWHHLRSRLPVEEEALHVAVRWGNVDALRLFREWGLPPRVLPDAVLTDMLVFHEARASAPSLAEEVERLWPGVVDDAALLDGARKRDHAPLLRWMLSRGVVALHDLDGWAEGTHGASSFSAWEETQA